MSDFTTDLVGICRAFGIYERDAICCGTVTVSQCVVMQRLLSEEESDISTLASLLGVTNGAMTRLVDGLERREFARRVRSSEDRRRVVVELTDAGRVEATRLRELTERTVDAVLGGVPRGKRKQVVESVALIRRALEAARDELACC